MVLLFTAIICSATATALWNREGDGVTDIIIVTTPNPTSNPNPKSPSHSPISAKYYESSNSVVFSFLTNLGHIHTSIINFDTGEIVCSIIDSSLGMDTVIISGDSGHYGIFLTASGQSYIGNFDLTE